MFVGFKRLKSRLRVQIAPKYINNISAGIDEYLAQMRNKYVPELDGVVLEFSNIQRIQTKCVLKSDSPFMFFYISLEITLFSPKRNDILGVVNKVSPDHIGCLVNGFFNASIAKDRFAIDLFDWDMDNHYWTGSSKDELVLIKPGSIIKFSVIKVVTSNDILSLHGSLLEQDTGVIDTKLLDPPPDANYVPITHEFTKIIYQSELALDEETEIEESIQNPRITQDISDEEDDEEIMVTVPPTAVEIKSDEASPESKPSAKKNKRKSYSSEVEVSIPKKQKTEKKKKHKKSK